MQHELIEREVANYSRSTFPPPRDFQTAAHEKLREGARAGHRCQLLMAPTGAGKTYLGMRVAHEALLRGKKALFVCDRTTLIDQTSAVADSYGLAAHGVIQSQHWRTDRSASFQICSLQTLARRGWPLRKSLSTAVQMWGRGLRASPDTGKVDCLLLDFSGNIVRFADDFADIFYNGLDSLDMGEKLDKAVRKDEEREPKSCPKCGYTPCGKRCIACGHEVVRPSLIVHEAGEMLEFKVGKATIGDKLAVWEQSVTLCRGQGNPDTAKGRAAHLFKSITGVFPRNLPDFETTPNVAVSRAVMNKARANSIAFRHRRAA